MSFILEAVVALIPLNQADCDQLNIKCPANASGADIAAKIQTFITPLIILSATIFIAVLIYSGVQYVTSRGNEEQAATAKRTILYALIGIIIIGMAGIVVNALLSRRVPAELLPPRL